jgi:hypothetical protein
MLPFRDVLNFHDNKLEPAHVAWVQSTLHNLTCYLSYTGIVHHDISPDTYFISPKEHEGHLLGGWWYALTVGSPLRQLPSRTFQFLPWEVKTRKLALVQTDLELIRAFGREALGDINGTKLKGKVVPKAMLNWMNNVAGDDAVEEYKRWRDVLTDSFGKRKFVKMDLGPEQIYP